MIEHCGTPRRVVENQRGRSQAKNPPQQPAIELSESKDKEGVEDQHVILEGLEALEQAQRLSPGHPAPSGKRVKGQVTHQVSHKQFQARVHNHLVCLGQSKGVVIREAGGGQAEEGEYVSSHTLGVIWS